MSGLLVLGAGGHGRVVADAARATGLWTELAFLDDRCADLGSVDDLPVLGPLSAADGLRLRFPDAVVAIGDNRRRLEVLARLGQSGFALPVLVHPSAAVSGRATLGEGTVVLAQCAVNPGAHLGTGCIVNTGATVDHDCRIGSGVHLSPGVHLGGNVTIGDRTRLGVGAGVRNGVTVGADVIVGVGAAVVCDHPGGLIVVGVPARAVERAQARS